jgi:hypothetical protein
MSEDNAFLRWPTKLILNGSTARRLESSADWYELGKFL